MLQFQVIGNLGRDAEVKSVNGSQFVSFNVAATESWIDNQGNRQERTTWVSCALNGDGGKLLPYLKKGRRVYVSGDGSVKLYSSAVQRRMMAGANIAVRTIELLGGEADEVPAHLYTSDGEQVDITKAYYTNDPLIVDCMLASRSGRLFRVDGSRYVHPINEEATDAADNATANED